MRHFLRNSHGGVAITFAFALPVLLVGVGVAVDYSALTRRQAELQLLADASALSGARALAESQAIVPAQKEQDARRAAQAYLTDSGLQAQAVIKPSAATDTVSVELSSEESLTFGAILGTRTKSIGVAATATFKGNTAACIIALDPDRATGIEMVGSGNIDAPRCGVQSNATGLSSIAMQGAPKMTARAVCASGGVKKARSWPPAKAGCDTLSDPYEQRKHVLTSGPSALIEGNLSRRCDYQNVSIAAETKGTVTLSPGVYCGGLSIQSATVLLQPGLYHMQDGPLSVTGSATLRGPGVSVLLHGTGAVLNFQGSPTVTMEAMTTGPLAGIAIASDPAGPPGLTSTLQGSPDLNLTGSLWLSRQVLHLQGSPTVTLNGPKDKAIAAAFTLQGSPDLTVKADDTLSREPGYANLRLAK